MNLHNPPNLKLPALKIEKKQDRELIENDSAVKSLIDSKLLLNKSLNQLFLSFLTITKNINKLLEKKDEYSILDYSFRSKRGSRIRYIPYRHLEWRLTRRLKKATKVQQQEIEAEFKKEIQERRKKINQQLKNKINKLSNKIQSELDIFEKKHKNKLNILESLNLYVCSDCKKIIFKDRFCSMTCDCGKKIENPSDCNNITIYMLGKNIINFIENSMWLEHGIDYLLRKKNFNTLCGFHILGHSGIWHEVDNVAEMKSDILRIFCECKDKNIAVNEVFVFAGKMVDIGCTRGYMFTTSLNTSEEVKHLARSKNITIIEQVLEKDDKKIIKEIKEGF